MLRCFFENIFEILLLPGSNRPNHNLRHESYPHPKAWKINQAFGSPNTNGNLRGKTRNVEDNYAVFSYMFRLIVVACLNLYYRKRRMEDKTGTSVFQD